MSKLLLISETVLPISSPPLTDGAVYIESGEIKEVGLCENLKKKYPAIMTINLGKGVLLPGFVNAHTHLELGWIRNRIEKPNSFIDWIEQIIIAKRGNVTREELESSIEEGIRSLISSGVTTVGEISSYGGIDEPFLKRSGLRTILFSELFDWHKDFWNSLTFEREELFEVRPFPHAPYSCSPEFLKKVLEFHHRSSVPLGIHLAESIEETKFVRGVKNGFEKRIFPIIEKEAFSRERAETPFQYMKKLKFFYKTKVSAVHMVHVSPSEIEEIRKFNIGVVLCPRSNYFLRVGSPNLKHYYNLKRIGIGTDGLSSNLNIDFLEELRFFYLLASKTLGKNASFFTVYAATLGGAKSIFLEDKIGSIESGKDADLIFIKTDRTSTDPYISVISSSRESLKMLMVKGNILHLSKELLGS